MNRKENTPKKMNHGPNMQIEKAKDFKGSIKRLFNELDGFKSLILVAFILACAGSILSILAPDKLSSLTNEISKGLVIDTKNFKLITKNVTNSLTEEILGKVMPYIINIDENSVLKVMTSTDISDSDKEKFKNILSDRDNMQKNISNLSDDVLDVLLEDSKYNDITITKSDKKEFLKNINNKENISFPNSIAKIIFKPFKVDNETISELDQAKFLSMSSKMDKKSSSKELYSSIDKMPKSIKKVVEPTMNMKKIKKIGILLSSFYILSAIFTFVQSLIMATVSNKFAKKLRSNISNKINKMPLKYFDKHQSGDILSRVTNDVDTIAQTMNQSLGTLVSSITLFLGTIIMMFYTNYIMAITAIVSSLLGFMFMFSVLAKSQKYFTMKQTELGNLNGHIEEVYSGLNVVKVYNGKKESNEKFDKYNKRVYEANRKSQFLSGLMMPMMGFIGNFSYVMVCLVGALLTMNDVISFGVIVAFIVYVRLFTSPLSQIAQAMNSLQSTAAASERVFEFVDEEEMSNEKKIKKYLNKDKVKGKIEFDHVMFKYDGNENPTIKDFNAKIKPGQKVAIVGPTGAGKTTMVNLLMKFYEINSGDIRIDDVSTKELSRKNIHELFTMVLQDTWLFEGTIKENIIYNRKNVTDEKVKEVCKIVGLDHFIRTMPKGYNSFVSDNDSVSAGQRQLLTIARSMINDSPFLILDEATSNVDTRTEELVQKAMDKLTEGKTSFIIAHRLSTIKNADLILVMKDGNIIEQGSHNELMKKKGFYSELYNSQFEK
mgnify:FL=1